MSQYENYRSGTIIVPASKETPSGYYPLEVIDVIEETSEAKSFSLKAPSEYEEFFGYQSGQFLTFSLEVTGEILRRCYSFSSSPDTHEFPTITVKRIQDGRASNWMNDTLGMGSRLYARPPAGRFVLESRDRPLVLLAAGSGITPVISLLRTALLKSSQSITLFYANRDRPSTIFYDEINRMMATYPDQLTVVHHNDVEQGFIQGEKIEALVRPEVGAQYYLCGPAPFMSLCESSLESGGIASEDIHCERFASLSADPQSETNARRSESRGKAEDNANREVVVKIDGKTQTISCSGDKTLLVAAQQAGLDPPCGCEEGLCGACSATLLEGDVRMDNEEGLSSTQRDNGEILTCQSYPLTRRCTIEYAD